MRSIQEFLLSSWLDSARPVSDCCFLSLVSSTAAPVWSAASCNLTTFSFNSAAWLHHQEEKVDNAFVVFFSSKSHDVLWCYLIITILSNLMDSCLRMSAYLDSCSFNSRSFLSCSSVAAALSPSSLIMAHSKRLKNNLTLDLSTT